VGSHIVAGILLLLQCSLVSVLAYRLYLLSHTHKGSQRNKATVNNVKVVLRVSVFIMTALQCVRIIDPFGSLGVWPYAFTRVLQLFITISIYFQYSATCYIWMDTLYVCALKRTPRWLAVVISVVPCSQIVVGFVRLIGEFTDGGQWTLALINFYTIFTLLLNVVTYNVSGFLLVRILRSHEVAGVSTNASEDITGSKSASPFNVVITNTIRSMVILTVPTLGCMALFFVVGLSNSKSGPIPAYNPNNIGWNVFLNIFFHYSLGLLFTRVAWISKSSLDAEIVSSVQSRTVSQSSASRPKDSPDQKRSSGLASRADMKEKAARLSQMPPSHSEEFPGRDSEAELEAVAVAVVDDLAAVAVSEAAVSMVDPQSDVLHSSVEVVCV